jgi:predicted ATPase/class 3 adenylate cyclase
MPDPAPVAPGLLPSGTVTFVFTDIEGSTQRWERDRAAMEEAVRRHDAVVGAAITGCGGHVFKTVGDAFCAAFSRAQDAVAAALAVQRALAAEDFSAVGGLHVRVAIHTGSSDERNNDYFGPAVNRVARLLALGHGGQVLVSSVTTELTHDALPAGATLRDLGEHRLKDLGRPERVYQLLGPDLTAEFPALRSVGVLRNNLPAVLSSFIGRETEIAEITALLAAHRLVTLTGSAGVGKTHTSLQVAANLLEGFGDGVWFIELAPLARGEYIPSTIALALGLTLHANGDPVENLARALKAKHALLVLDNCEHLVEPAGRTVAAILRGCPKVNVLASSRQGLGIGGEHTYRLPSLAEYTAIALFVDRARAVDQRFSLTDENAPALAEICRRLDGIPLAIELAAARMKVLGLRQLRDHLDERFQLLTGGSRDALPRQQTLRALIDWSHDLLDERERMLFRRSGTFVNGFTLDGAAAVGTGNGLNEADVLDVLASLVDKSLVLAEPAGDARRYRLLESTRFYACEKLDATGERDACARRHLQYLRDRFIEARERYESTAGSIELNDLATDLEDVRSALDWALDGPDVIVGAELLAAIGAGWRNVGLESEGLARGDAFFTALSEDESLLLARLSIAAAQLARNSGRTARGFEAATHAVAHARGCNDPPTLARALREYSRSAAQLRKFDDADAALAEAEAIPGVSVALHLRLLEARAVLSGERGDRASAALAFEQLRREYRSLGNVLADGWLAVILAESEHARGQTHRAIATLREVLPAFRAHGDRTGLVRMLAKAAGYLAAVDDLTGARAAAHEAIEALASREPESTFVTMAIEHLALTLAVGGDFERAARFAGYVDAAYDRLGFERDFTETTTHDRLTALLRKQLPPEELERLHAEGAALIPQAAVALVLEKP